MAATAVALNDQLKFIRRLQAILNAIRRTFCATFYTISTDSVLTVPLTLCVS